MKHLFAILLAVLCFPLSGAAQLTANFTTNRSFTAYYTQGFDTESDFNTWTVKSYNWNSTWEIADQISYSTPSFSTINPSSKASLVLQYSNNYQDERITSPTIEIKSNSRVEYYNFFSPIFLYQGSYKFYVIDTETGKETLLLDQFMWAQNTGYDEKKWKLFSFDLADYAGKKVQFSFRYKGSQGEDEMIDGFRVVQMDNSDEARVQMYEGEEVQFYDCSEGGKPTSWQWTFEGGTPSTSTEQHPTVTYTTGGTYAVTLTVSDGEQTSAKERKGYVTVMADMPNAIIGLPTEGYLSPWVACFVPLHVPVQLHDLSTGNPTSWQWTLQGCEPLSSTEQNPVVTYTKKGVYSLGLSVTNVAGTDTDVLQYAIQAGGAQYVWNIAPEENGNLAKLSLSQFGNYAGSNTLGMYAFAEEFEAPLAAATIDSVAIYFFSNTTISPDAPITVSVCSELDCDEVGTKLASATLKASELKCDEENWVPTVFKFSQPATVNSKFFIVVEGIPHAINTEGTPAADDIAIACVRREGNNKTTVWHMLEDWDENDKPLGTYEWIKNVDSPVSMAVSPVITYINSPSGITQPSVAMPRTAAPQPIYDLYGRKVERMGKGIYIHHGKKIMNLK